MFFDHYGNKVSMFETVKEVYKETVTKENNIFFTRYPTASIILGNFGYFDEIYTFLMIEEDVTKNQKQSEN